MINYDEILAESDGARRLLAFWPAGSPGRGEGGFGGRAQRMGLPFKALQFLALR